MFLCAAISCSFSLLEGNCCMNHCSVSTSRGGLWGPPSFRTYSQPTYRTFSRGSFGVSAVCQGELLVARCGLLSFGGCCHLFSGGCSSICFFVCLFPPWQGKKKIFQAHRFKNQRLEPKCEASEHFTRPGAAWALLPTCSAPSPGTHLPRSSQAKQAEMAFSSC